MEERRRESETDEFKAAVAERVKHNLSFFDASKFRGYDRIAMQHMMSIFAHLETIAVMAAERGDAIEGQLEDEYVHYETFAQAAEMCGGLVDPCHEVAVLIEYLKGLKGEASLAALNVTAESWLETVFDHTATWGIIDDMMRLIEEDEERHVHDALDAAKPPVEEITPIMRELEEMLEAISVSASFMLPFIHFAGDERTVEMGLALCDAHDRACDHLGVPSHSRRIRLMCRSQRIWARRKPEPIELTKWDETKMNIYRDVSNMILWFDVNIDETNGYKMQAKVIESLAKVLQRNPRLRYVTRREKLWKCKEPIIALRSMYDDRAVMNVFMPGCEMRDWREVLRQMRLRVKRARNLPYNPIPALPDGLSELIPPSRACAAVNYNGIHGGEVGTGPLSKVEGIPILLTIGEIAKDGKATITVLMDHRCYDGQDIGLLKKEMVEELQKYI